MEDVNLILESVKFMVLGMTVVFAFLTLLIIVVNVQAKIIAKFFPEEASKVVATSTQSDEPQRIAAIIAAVTEFRKR